MQQSQENLLANLPEDLRTALQGVDHKSLEIIITLLERLKEVQDNNNKLLLANQVLLARNQELAAELQAQTTQQIITKHAHRPVGMPIDQIMKAPTQGNTWQKLAQSTLFSPLATCLKAEGLTKVLKILSKSIHDDKEEWRGVYLEFIDGLHARLFIEDYNKLPPSQDKRLFLEFYPGKSHILDVVPVNDSELDTRCKGTPGLRGQLLLAELNKLVDLNRIEEIFFNSEHELLPEAAVARRSNG